MNPKQNKTKDSRMCPDTPTIEVSLKRPVELGICAKYPKNEQAGVDKLSVFIMWTLM